ncbi:Cullin-domain-containing protein [Neoconidiobolus thromboides FSU 785]|nr:Cullin-domain-containing protein [Neoconidiobolus thromboides FSU 785]
MSIVYETENKKVSSSRIHQLIYDICTARYESYYDKLFTGLVEFYQKICDNIRKKLLQQDSEILAIYYKEFELYSLASKSLNYYFSYFNDILESKEEEYYHRYSMMEESLIHHPKYTKQNVLSLSYSVWKNNIIKEIKKNDEDILKRQLRFYINKDRNGGMMDVKVIRGVIHSFVELNLYYKEKNETELTLYQNEFEIDFLNELNNYYASEAQVLISQLTIPKYLAKVESRIKQEIRRNELLLHSTTLNKSLDSIQTQLLKNNKELIYQSFETMIENENYDDCNRMYNLMSSFKDGILPLQVKFEDYVTNKGTMALKVFESIGSKDPREYVDLLLEVHHKFSSFCYEVLNHEPLFITALDKAFRKVINSEQVPNGAELLARYSDILLKKNSKEKINLSASQASFMARFKEQLGDSDIEIQLNDLIILFKYINDKDLFQKFYSRLLAKRLINNYSLSEDAEANMISKLKKACGLDYTNKLQKMLSDHNLNMDTNSMFKDYLLNFNINLKENYHFLVLTAGAWPLPIHFDPNFNIPLNLRNGLDVFTKFYLTRHNGRKLSWNYSLFKGDIKLAYLNRPYELTTNLYTISILLLFNYKLELSHNEIMQHLNFKELDVILKSLLDFKLLQIKDTSSESLNLDKIYTLNMKFSSKRSKIKLLSNTIQDVKKEQKEVNKELEGDRILYLQSMIVRIMKSRKTLNHTQLINEVINLAKNRFTPSVQDIKKNIDVLIDKQYLERANNENNVYLYVA